MTVEQDRSDLVFELADRLFGSYVDTVDRGGIINTRIDWVEVKQDGETFESPSVFIEGKPAGSVFKGIVTWTDEGSRLDKEEIEQGAKLFNDMMAGLDNAVEYQRGLRTLDAELGSLAISTEAGYFQAVREDLEEGGFGAVGDGESIGIARSYATQDIQVLGDAEEAGEAYAECYQANLDVIQTKFESTPGAYWVMVGVESGEIKASGPQGTVPTRESHIDLELGFGEELYVYLRPKS